MEEKTVRQSDENMNLLISSIREQTSKLKVLIN